MSESFPSLYYTFFSSIMAIYRDTFKETRDFPVAYASAVVTVIFGFFWIAFSYLLVRIEVWPNTWIDFPNFVLHNKMGAFVVLIIFYVCHCIYFVRKDRWKAILVEFDELTANQRLFSYVYLLVLSTSSVLWMVTEVIIS